jgi:GTP pyrophosphokinase
MHEVSEKGVAAHFNYKRGELPAQSVMDEDNIEDWLNLVRSVFENVGTGKTEDVLQNLKKVWQREEVYVFTPNRKFMVFPKDATPIDFAYTIHEDIGNSCIGAKVNGKIVPLNYKLQSSDQVEILRSSNSRPSPDWLDYVVTVKAKSLIQKQLKIQKTIDKEKGKQIWEDFLSKNDFKISEKKLNKIISSLNYNNANEFFIALSTTGFDEELTMDFVKELIWGKKKTKKTLLNKTNEESNGIDLDDLKPIPSIHAKKINYAQCCYPVQGDIVIAVLSENGKSIDVHRAKCYKIKSLSVNNTHNLFSMDWNLVKNGEYESKLVVLSKINEPNSKMLSEITPILSKFDKLSILGINFQTTEYGFSGLLTIKVPNLDYLTEIKHSLSKIKDIKSISRYLDQS